MRCMSQHLKRMFKTMQIGIPKNEKYVPDTKCTDMISENLEEMNNDDEERKLSDKNNEDDDGRLTILKQKAMKKKKRRRKKIKTSQSEWWPREV